MPKAWCAIFLFVVARILSNKPLDSKSKLLSENSEFCNIYFQAVAVGSAGSLAGLGGIRATRESNQQSNANCVSSSSAFRGGMPSCFPTVAQRWVTLLLIACIVLLSQGLDGSFAAESSVSPLICNEYRHFTKRLYGSCLECQPVQVVTFGTSWSITEAYMF
jgi:hypothetical protein